MPEPAPLMVIIDGVPHQVAGVTVAAALAQAGLLTLRRSLGGLPRGALCGMGACHECRVTIDGVAQRRACMEACRPGMRIDTDG